MTLVPVDTSSPLAVTNYLEQARHWLSTAVEMTGPQQIAAAKAEIATAAEATRQFNLSKECQLDATELVRRAEYALGKAIRKGQEEGAITTRRDGGPRGDYERNGYLVRVDQVPDETKVSPSAFIPHGQEMKDVRDIAEATPADFDAALNEARSEGNLSRANVVRKVKVEPTGARKTRAAKADLLEELAAQGYSSRQMCKALDYARDDQVRELAREYGIEIPADKQIGRSRRINSAHVVENTATALEGLVMGVELVNHEEIDPALASQWVDSLTESMRVLNRFVRQIKEKTQ